MTLIMTVVGFFLRLIGSNQSFWLDEGASIEIASTPLPDFFTKMASDFHPPLFYLLLKSWLPLAGTQEWLIRLPFIILATLTIPALYLLLKEMMDGKNKLAPIIGIVLLSLSPFHIYYSQELRMYSLNALLTTLSWLYLLRFQKNSTTKNLIFFTLFSTLNLYTFYGAFFNLVSQAIFIIFKKIKPIHLLSALAVSILLFLPWLPILTKQLEAGGYLKNALPGWQVLSGTLTLKSLFLIPLKLIFGRISFTPKIIYYLLAGVTSFIYLSLAFFGSFEKKSRSLIIWILTPLIISSIISLKTPILGYWRFLYLLPGLIAFVSIGISRFSLPLRIFISWFLIILTVIPTVIYHATPFNHREDWRSLSQFVTQPDSLLIVNFPIPFAPLKFYSPGSKYFFTQESLGKEKPDLIKELLVTSQGKTYIYLLEYLSDLTDPQRSVQKQIEQAGFKKVGVRSFNNLGFVYQYQPPSQ